MGPGPELQPLSGEEEAWILWSTTHGCCWETFYIFAYCGLVGNPHLTAKFICLLPFQRQPSTG